MPPREPQVRSKNEAAEYEGMVEGEWTWLYDSYELGTVFITDDPMEAQVPIVEGLRPEQATDIVAAHNMTIRAALDWERRRTVEQLARGIHEWKGAGHKQRNPVCGEAPDDCDIDARAILTESAER